MTRLLALLAALLISALVPANVGISADLDPQVRAILERHRIEPSEAGVSAFLRSLNPDDAVNSSVHALIGQLGDDKYTTREAATQKLIELSIVPEACLADAAASPDLEVRDRAAHVLRRSKGTQQWQVAQAVFRAICGKEIKGLAGEVLDARRWIDHEPTRTMIAEVLTATAVPEDADLLRKEYSQADPPTKAMFVGALAVSLRAHSPEALRPLLANSEPRIRLVAVRTLLKLGDRDALAALGPLLNVEDPAIRCEAIVLFQAATAQPTTFVAYKDATERRAAMTRLSKWLDEQGKTIELRLPLPSLLKMPGRVTVCLSEANRVLDLDIDGKLVEELQSAASPKGCERQPNGNWMVASYKGRHLAEFDANGVRLWELSLAKLHDLKGPMRVSRLANGNFLAPFLDSMTVAEVDPQGNLVWQVKNNLWPTDAKRLENGNTLVTLAESGVVEYNPAGNIVWQIEGLKSQRPDSAQRLPNGNTLVSLNKVHRVEEFDTAGKSVWSGEFQKPRDSLRLADGSTIVSEESGIKRIDHDGQLLWHYPVADAAGIRVY